MSPKSRMATLFLAALLALGCAAAAEAASFDCVFAPNGEPTCIYQGPVRYTYANDSDGLLLFWDSSITPALVQAEAESVGYPASVFDAGSVNTATEPDFSGFLFSIMLTAQVSGAEVTIQMRPPADRGRLRIDRVWMRSPGE